MLFRLMILLLFDIAGLGDMIVHYLIVSNLNNLVSKKLSRQCESEADEMGLNISLLAC